MERDNRSSVGRILLGILTFIAVIAAAYYVVIRVAARVANGVDAPRRVKSGEKPVRAARAKRRDENESGIRDFRFDDDDINDCFDADDDGDDEDALEVVICGAKEAAEDVGDKLEDAFEGFADAAEDAFDDIADAAEDIADDIADAAEDAADELTDAVDALSEDSLDQLLDN